MSTTTFDLIPTYRAPQENDQVRMTDGAVHQVLTVRSLVPKPHRWEVRCRDNVVCVVGLTPTQRNPSIWSQVTT